jgi:hypothetical protein
MPARFFSGLIPQQRLGPLLRAAGVVGTSERAAPFQPAFGGNRKAFEAVFPSGRIGTALQPKRRSGLGLQLHTQHRLRKPLITTC